MMLKLNRVAREKARTIFLNFRAVLENYSTRLENRNDENFLSSTQKIIRDLKETFVNAETAVKNLKYLNKITRETIEKTKTEIEKKAQKGLGRTVFSIGGITLTPDENLDLSIARLAQALPEDLKEKEKTRWMRIAAQASLALNTSTKSKASANLKKLKADIQKRRTSQLTNENPELNSCESYLRSNEKLISKIEEKIERNKDISDQIIPELKKSVDALSQRALIAKISKLYVRLQKQEKDTNKCIRDVVTNFNSSLNLRGLVGKKELQRAKQATKKRLTGIENDFEKLAKLTDKVLRQEGSIAIKRELDEIRERTEAREGEIINRRRGGPR